MPRTKLPFGSMVTNQASRIRENASVGRRGCGLFFALHPLPTPDLWLAGLNTERAVDDLDLAVALVVADRTPVDETRERVSVNECSAEPSANSFLPPGLRTRTRHAKGSKKRRIKTPVAVSARQLPNP